MLKNNMKQEIEITLTFPPNTGYIEKYVYIPPFAPSSSNSFSFKKITSKIMEWYIENEDKKIKRDLKADLKMTYLGNYIPKLGTLNKKKSRIYKTTIDEKILSHYPVSRNTYQFTITDSNGKYIEHPETIFVKLKMEFYN